MSKATADLVRVLITVYGDTWRLNDDAKCISLEGCVSYWSHVAHEMGEEASGVAYSPDTGEVWIGTLNPPEPWGGPSAALPPWAGFNRWQPEG